MNVIKNILVAALLLSSSAALAVPVYTPVGLSPGDQYQLAFVTTSRVRGYHSDISVYNDFVQREANWAFLGTSLAGLSWTAIASTIGVDARDNAVLSAGEGLFSLSGERVARTAGDLWGGRLESTIKNSSGMDAGRYPNGGFFDVWTGSDSRGVGRDGGQLGQSEVAFGFAEYTNATWLVAGSKQAARLGGGAHAGIYAMSSVITVAQVPEPSIIVLFAAGLFGLGVFRRRRQT